MKLLAPVPAAQAQCQCMPRNIPKLSPVLSVNITMSQECACSRHRYKTHVCTLSDSASRHVCMLSSQVAVFGGIVTCRRVHNKSGIAYHSRSQRAESITARRDPTDSQGHRDKDSPDNRLPGALHGNVCAHFVDMGPHAPCSVTSHSLFRETIFQDSAATASLPAWPKPTVGNPTS